MENKLDRKKINLDISAALHRDIKVASARRNVSMSKWINRALIEYLKKETRYEKITETDN